MWLVLAHLAGGPCWHAWHGIRERWWNQKKATGSSRGRVEEKDEGGRPGAQETTRLGTTGRCMHADAAAGCSPGWLAGRGGKTQIIPAHFRHPKRAPELPLSIRP